MATTPLHILKKLRQRLRLEENDNSRDAEIEKMTPVEKLDGVCAWELGHPGWGNQFVTWARACGMTVEGAD